MTLRKFLLPLLLVFSFTLFLTACGEANEQSVDEGTNTAETDQQEGTVDEGTNNAEESADKGTAAGENTPYTVEHAMGTETIEKTPERVVILTNEGTEALLALGLTPVGAVESWLGDPWYEHISEDMADVQVVGTESAVNLEAIAELAPDLIIGNKMRQEEIYPQLAAIAPTVFAETLRGEWQNNFQLYAKAVNRDEQGQQVLNEYNDRIASLKEQLGDQLSKEISMVRFMASDVRIYHKDSFSGIILDQLGFARPGDQNNNDFAEKGVTKERIPAMDGDVLFYFTYEPGDGEATTVEEEWINDPLFQNLEAVKAGNVYKVDDAIWNTAGGVIAANLMLDDIEEYFLK
ncbi:iron-siderophore ABC transporter substrate-binding protein [Bacillus sp. HMF5848]|uniref:ABC transporter substrate-binding protein n=1 Tax=Bacillus sp. HMF5848 TaxID=2495421 RepID=UPI000F7ADA5F|nr:iron-siderophore ABC transporter substrate-binding protein [Bacillus sp. HMF5848]RSK28479.1 iron-siderophore ABC transporter substrate-binding protein [Bacillus sp. HMF5848]